MKSTPDYPRIALRVPEACASLAISKSKFYEEVAAGRIKAFKVGGRTIIPVAEIEAYLAGLPAKAA